LSTSTQTRQFKLEPDDALRLAKLCGQFDQNLRQIESRLGIKIANRGNHFRLTGDGDASRAAHALIHALYREAAQQDLTPEAIHLHLQQSGLSELMQQDETNTNSNQDKSDDQAEDNFQPSQLASIDAIQTKRKLVRPRGINQINYIDCIRNNDINFGVGPAGTGKTWLAVAAAVEALDQHRVDRLLLVRPAVEAGEKLGFLPGDLTQKIDPYLRPLYDALYEMMGVEQVTKKMERNIIEVAPLAFMRGRTLNNSFIILDESQNTTREQMKMFLTRIGFGSTAVITGDVTQIDLPSRNQSGLLHARKVLRNVKGITFTEFNSRDVVRHPLVQRIVDAYAESEQADNEQTDNN